MYYVVCAASTCPINRYFYTDDLLVVEKAIFHAMWAHDYHLKNYRFIRQSGVEYCFTNAKNELLYVYRYKMKP